MKTSEKHAHGCCLFLGSKVHLLSAIVFVHIEFMDYKSLLEFLIKPGHSLLEVLLTLLGTVSRSSSHQSMFSKVTFFRFIHGNLNPLTVFIGQTTDLHEQFCLQTTGNRCSDITLC